MRASRSPAVLVTVVVEITAHLEMKPKRGGSPPRERRIIKSLIAPRWALFEREPSIFILNASNIQRLKNRQIEMIT